MVELGVWQQPGQLCSAPDPLLQLLCIQLHPGRDPAIFSSGCPARVLLSEAWQDCSALEGPWGGSSWPFQHSSWSIEAFLAVKRFVNCSAIPGKPNIQPGFRMSGRKAGGSHSPVKEPIKMTQKKDF